MTEQEAPLPRTYTKEQLKEILQVNTNTIQRLIRDGEIQCIRIGRLVRITQAQLDAFLAKGSAVTVQVPQALKDMTKQKRAEAKAKKARGGKA